MSRKGDKGGSSPENQQSNQERRGSRGSKPGLRNGKIVGVDPLDSLGSKAADGLTDMQKKAMGMVNEAMTSDRPPGKQYSSDPSHPSHRSHVSQQGSFSSNSRKIVIDAVGGGGAPK